MIDATWASETTSFPHEGDPKMQRTRFRYSISQKVERLLFLRHMVLGGSGSGGPVHLLNHGIMRCFPGVPVGAGEK